MSHTVIKTAETQIIKPLLDRIHIPQPASHKGQNGRGLIIGGSQLFHSASIWAAETASHFLDIAHYSSTVENNEVFLALKKKFHNGIIIQRKDIPFYVKEDDAILIGPGMVRGERKTEPIVADVLFERILKIPQEADFTRSLTAYLLTQYPDKKFVLDAGALQMMDPAWFLSMRQPPVITPHQLEFETLFGIPVQDLSLEDKIRSVEDIASRYKVILLLKAVVDIVSDGTTTYVIEGGNQGLTKGGTGDMLAGLVLSLFAKTDGLAAATLASYLLKRTADELFTTKGYWYNVDDLIEKIPTILKNMLYN